MRIRKERTRLIFTEYTEFEKLKLDKLVGTDDRVFWYNDPDDNLIVFFFKNRSNSCVNSESPLNDIKGGIFKWI